jgi:hypothetical protein
MILDRLVSPRHRLTDKTVFAERRSHVERVLARVRSAQGLGGTLNMSEFIALGVLPHLQDMGTLREQVQTLRHLDPAPGARVPLDLVGCPVLGGAPGRARGDAAGAGGGRRRAAARSPGRHPWPGHAPRAGHRWHRPGRERAFSPPYTQGRRRGQPQRPCPIELLQPALGVPEEARVETRNRHETAILRDYDRSPRALTRERQTLFLVDRAFIDARFRDAKTTTCAITIITRMKANLRIDSTEGLGIAADPLNAGVQRDLRVMLASSPEPSRLITDRPDWTAPLFRDTAKVSRQVLRFFKHCFPKPASPALYERELRPLLMAYLSGRPDTVEFDKDPMCARCGA